MRVTRLLPVLLPAAAATVLIGGPVAGAADTTPRQQLEASAKSFAKVKSYRLTLTTTDEDGRGRIRADVSTAGRVDLSVTLGRSGTFRLRQIGSTTFLRGDARYWRANAGRDGAAVAKKLAGRWIRLARSDSREFAGLVDEVSPRRIARCLVNPAATGTLTDGGTATVAGRKASVISDAGDQPGTAPGKLFVAADGPPLPLRVLQTGKVRPGGKETACTDPDDTSTSSDARFSRFDEKLSITAPKNAIRIPATGGGSSDSTTA